MMKIFKQIILEIANNPQRGEEFNNYLNSVFPEGRGDMKRPWDTKPKKQQSGPNVSKKPPTSEYLKQKQKNSKLTPPQYRSVKRQNDRDRARRERWFDTEEHHVSWFRDKIGSSIPFTYSIADSPEEIWNRRTNKLAVLNVRDRGRGHFVIDLGARSFAEDLDEHGRKYVESLILNSDPFHASHNQLTDHLEQISAIHRGEAKNEIVGIKFNPGKSEQNKDPILSIHVPKRHILKAWEIHQDKINKRWK